MTAAPPSPTEPAAADDAVPRLEVSGVRYYKRHHALAVPAPGTLVLDRGILSYRGKKLVHWMAHHVDVAAFQGRVHRGFQVRDKISRQELATFTHKDKAALDVVRLRVAAATPPVSASAPPAAAPPLPAAAAADMAASAPPQSLPPTTSRRIPATCAATFGGVAVRYAYVSQKGYYPDDLTKANQDACTTKHGFAGREADAFFGVFDGHGPDGDKCAQFVRKQLPSLLAKRVAEARDKQGGGAGAGAETELGEDVAGDVLSRAHTETNGKLSRKAQIDDQVSGTTSMSLYLHGAQNKITVSNVGDSRAVIGRATRREGGGEELEAFALSQDQTPYRLDERVRLRRAGARIRTCGQLDGLKPVDEDEVERDERQLAEGEDDGGMKLGEEIDEEGDPPRVFSMDGDYPGCAFSRSIGDAVGKELGVIPEPEIATFALTPEDKVIVLASDGVFEFLTNQSVVDMCARIEDPLEACQAVVARAFRLWLQNEVRADDITIICIFVDGVVAPACGDSTAGERTVFRKIQPLSRPLRRGTSQEKSQSLLNMLKSRRVSDAGSRRVMLETIDDSEIEFDLETLYTDKTDKQKAVIDQMWLQFQDITEAQRELIHKVMTPMDVKKGQIFEEGDEGDCMYFVEDGSFEVRMGGVAVIVHEASAATKYHPTFGDLALLHDAPRTASVFALRDGRLWSFHWYAWKKITGEWGSRKNAKAILKRGDKDVETA